MENNQMVIFGGNENISYCSKKIETEEEKREMFNALESCDVLLNDCVGTEIEIKDIYVQKIKQIDKETGEYKDKYRIIIFDVNGQTYATGSYGIYNIIRKIFQCFGTPENWEKPLKVKIEKQKLTSGKQSLTLKLI